MKTTALFPVILLLAACSTPVPDSAPLEPIVEDNIYDPNAAVIEPADPITSVTWWGSFSNWNDTTLPVMLPLAYQLGIWTAVPAGTDQTWSHPAEMIWEIGAISVDTQWVGWDYDPRTQLYESCYRFEIDLTEDQWFYQDPGANSVYWLSIGAAYLPGMMHRRASAGRPARAMTNPRPPTRPSVSSTRWPRWSAVRSNSVRPWNTRWGPNGSWRSSWAARCPTS